MPPFRLSMSKNFTLRAHFTGVKSHSLLFLCSFLIQARFVLIRDLAGGPQKYKSMELARFYELTRHTRLGMKTGGGGTEGRALLAAKLHLVDGMPVAQA